MATIPTKAAPERQRSTRFSRIYPFVHLGLAALLHGGAYILSILSLQDRIELERAAYIPLLVVGTFLLSVLLVFLQRRPTLIVIVILIKTLLIQLTLIPFGFPTTLKILLVSTVLMETTFLLGFPLSLIIALGEMATFLLGQGARTVWGLELSAASPEELAGLGLISLLVLVLSFSMQASLRSLRSARQELRHVKEGLQHIVQANVSFQELAVEVEQASMERERLRITRDIHDIVGYTLTNQTMVLQAAMVLIDKDHEKLRELLDMAQEASRSGLQEVRQALHRLRRHTPLAQAFLNRLLKLCKTFEQATGVKVDFFGPQTPEDLPPALEVVIYRMIQEGLTNSFLHGKASQVSVNLYLEEVHLVVWLSDNGRSATEITEGIGLAGMKERLLPFEGKLEYHGSENGFTIKAVIPWIGEERLEPQEP